MKGVRLCIVHFAALFIASALTWAATYNIGPGQPVTTIGAIDWQNLKSGDVVNIYWRAQPYHEKIQLCVSGVTLRGIPDANGNRPIIDGRNATTPSSVRTTGEGTQWDTNGNGLIHVGRSSVQSTNFVLSNITIENLEIVNAYPGNNDGGPYYYFDRAGTKTVWANFTAGIYILGTNNVTVRNCWIHDNGLGLFAKPDTNLGSGSTYLVVGNKFDNNGAIGDYGQHHVYTEVNGITIEYNDFGKIRAGSNGVSIKDRSAGTIIRYNHFINAMFAFITDCEDDLSMRNLPSWAWCYVYGNIFNDFNQSPFYFGGGRKNMAFYNNTVVMQQNQSAFYSFALWWNLESQQHIDARNNVIFLGPTTPGQNTPIFKLLGIDGSVSMGANWISPGWINGEGTVTGAGNLTSPANNDPGFVSLSGKNFHLTAGSSAIGKSTALDPSWPVVDKEYVSLGVGKARASAADFGAQQFSEGQAGSSPPPAPPVPVPSEPGRSTPVTVDGGQPMIVPAVWNSLVNKSTPVVFRHFGRGKKVEIYGRRGNLEKELVTDENGTASWLDPSNLPVGVYLGKSDGVRSLKFIVVR